MSAEILKSYRLRKGNRQRLIESVFGLWKFSWMENGRLLAKKGKDHYLFLRLPCLWTLSERSWQT